MIPDRRVAGRKSSNRNPNATVFPGVRRGDFQMVSHALLKKDFRRSAKLRDLEGSRYGRDDRLAVFVFGFVRPFGLFEFFGVAALLASKARDVLDIVEAVAEKRESEIDEQQRKQGRRPAALQALMKPDVDPIAAQTVNAVIRQTRWRAGRYPPDRTHAIRNARSDCHSPYGEGGHEQSQQDEGDRRTGIAVDPGRGEAWQEPADKTDDVRDPADRTLELVGALRSTDQRERQ